MKNTAFITALAALPSFINAFSTYNDLYIRDVEDYDTVLSVRDALPHYDTHGDSFEIVMRSLESSFIGAAVDTAAFIAKREVEDDLFDSFLIARAGDQYKMDERDFTSAASAYAKIDGDSSKTCDDKIAAAEKVLALAKKVVSGRKAKAKEIGDKDPGHQQQIKQWEQKVISWQQTVSRQKSNKKCEEKKKEREEGKKKTRSIDELEFLDFLSEF